MAFHSLKYIIAAGGVALLLGGAAFGVVSAQQPTPTPSEQPAQVGRGPHHQQFLEALAAKLGISTQRLQQAMDEVHRELGPPPGRAGHRGGPHGGGGMNLDVAAGTIGIPLDQLHQELTGKTLTDVARAHNVDPKAVADALKADHASRVDQAVANGRLTAEQAAQAKVDGAAKVDDMMTRTFAPVGPREGRGQGHGGHWRGGDRGGRGEGRGPERPASPTAPTAAPTSLQ